MEKVIVALYDDYFKAQRAIREMRSQGIERKEYNLISHDPQGKLMEETEPEKESRSEEIAEGAGAGALVGGLAGLLIGLSSIAIPGIGGVLLGGPLLAALAGAGVGAGIGGLVRALSDVGIPEEEAEIYAEGIRRGGHLVLVKVAPEKVELVTGILEDHDPLDVKFQAERWREEGWTGFDESAEPFPFEERGERKSAFAEALEDTAEEMEYEPVAHYTPKINFEDWEPMFQNHYENAYVPGSAYETLRPAYLFGYQAAYDNAYFDKDWSEIKTSLQEDWRRENPDRVWDEVKLAIEEAYTTVRTKRSPQDDHP